MKVVGSYAQPVEAHLVRNWLQAGGITAYVYDDLSPYAGVSPAVGGVRVAVADEDFAAAQEILAQPPPAAS